jgi:exopolyphosphatase/guanosine-5'-triphosphate,3'-diphosphate pyrophosphatase
MWAPDDRRSRDVAVIDVGSNSVRLVIYRIEGRAIWTVYNEKVLAGLGRKQGESRRLSSEGVKTALAALRRFRAVLDGADTSETYIAATAAVRDAVDGPDFIAKVRAETGMKVRVLSGTEEAHYSALGVAAGQPDASGVVGDLGGSSLELVRMRHGEPGEGVTLPLGPFALGAPGEIDPAAVRTAVAERLGEVAPAYRSDCLHAVGGAWRNIALIQMEAVQYPLRIVHQYEMTARDAVDAARFVARQSRQSLEQMPGVSKKRAETLPHAALVLEGLVEQLGLSRVCFSAFGLREGLLLESMPKAVRLRDPLVEGCAALGARQGAADRLGPALEQWLSPLWTALAPVFGGDANAEPQTGRDAILMAAACRLADLGARLHPDHRAQLAFDQVLRAPIPGQTHPERAFLAAAVFSRHTSGPLAQADAGIERILSPERLRRARALGAAIRLGCDLSGRVPALLTASTLAIDRDLVTLTVKRASADLLLGEQTRKRLQALASVLELEGKIRTA